MSDSVRPHRRQPTGLPHPWDSPGKNTGVGCHFLLQCIKVKSDSEVAQSCLTLCDPMDCSLPGSSAHGIFQMRALEWGAIAFSKHLIYVSVYSSWIKYPVPSWLSLSLLSICRGRELLFLSRGVGRRDCAVDMLSGTCWSQGCLGAPCCFVFTAEFWAPGLVASSLS